MDVQNKITVCKLVTQAILMDSKMQDQELAFLDNLMKSYGLNDEQRKQAKKINVTDEFIDELAHIHAKEEKQELIHELMLAVAVDQEVTEREYKLVEKVAQRLHLSTAAFETMWDEVQKNLPTSGC